MRPSAALCGLMMIAGRVLAMPAIPEARDIEVILHKRDAVLTPRDLELAALHGVNVSEMYRHTVFKRSDGDDFTIWVANSFEDGPEEGPEEGPGPQADSSLNARQATAVHTFFAGPQRDECGTSSFTGTTGDTSPGTGASHRIRNWANSNPGRFRIGAHCCSTWYDLVVGGTNTGNNARFGVRKHDLDFGYYGYVGNRDIYDLVVDSLARFIRRLNGGDRMSATGGMRCNGERAVLPPTGVSVWFNWRIAHYPHNVGG